MAPNQTSTISINEIICPALYPLKQKDLVAKEKNKKTPSNYVLLIRAISEIK
jgi:hypothetical protein